MMIEPDDDIFPMFTKRQKWIAGLSLLVAIAFVLAVCK